MVAPSAGEGSFRSFGHPIPDIIATNSAARGFVTFFARWIGTILIGSNALTLFIAPTAFRKGERWAWWAFWYWPFLFAVHFFMYSGSFKTMQAIWFLLTAGILLANRRKFLART